MSESKTPMTDAKTNTVQMPISINEWVTVSVVSSDFAKQLELENAELKRQLDEGVVCGNCDHKRARIFLEKQIQEGELVPVEVVEDWTFEHRLAIPVVGGMSLKQFAAERHRCSTIADRPSSSPAT